MIVSCPNCDFFTEVSEDRLPAPSFQARCPRCRKSFTAGGQGALPEAPAASEGEGNLGFCCPKCAAKQEPGEICIRCGVVFRKLRVAGSEDEVVVPLSILPDHAQEESEEDPSRLSLINIMALLFLLDSSLILIMRVPSLTDVLGQGAMSFHMKAKYLYDVVTAFGMFVTSFGLSMRKEWARVAMIVLLSLGLAEGLYMISYQETALVDLEQKLQESFADMKKNNNKKLIGCAVYLYFIVMLCTRKMKARFR